MLWLRPAVAGSPHRTPACRLRYSYIRSIQSPLDRTTLVHPPGAPPAENKAGARRRFAADKPQVLPSFLPSLAGRFSDAETNPQRRSDEGVSMNSPIEHQSPTDDEDAEWIAYWDAYGSRADSEACITIRVGVLRGSDDHPVALRADRTASIMLTDRAAAHLAELLRWALEEREMLARRGRVE